MNVKAGPRLMVTAYDANQITYTVSHKDGFWRIWPAGNEWAYKKSGAGLLVIPDARINEGYGHN